MSSGSITARYYQTGQPVILRWKAGRVTRFAPTDDPAPDSLWLAPILFDLQVNGFAGVDFQQENLSGEQLLHACRHLRHYGCGQFLLTLITDHWEVLLRRLQHLIGLRAADKELQSAIAGWHIEGPFLSAEPGYSGAHVPEAMIDPRREHIRELRRITGEDPVLITLAPERPHSLPVIREAARKGMRVSLGHTNATLKNIRAAGRAGATGFTHLGNGCPRELDRSDNILWRILETPELLCGLIPDGIHVSPHLFRLFHRTIPRDKIYYTTDAMAAAGAAPGQYSLGKMSIEVGQDQIVRQPGQKTFAGSALRPIDGIVRAAKMLGLGWPDVWDYYSVQPASFMGMDYLLGSRLPANFCLITMDSRNQISHVETYFHGIPAPRCEVTLPEIN